MRKVTNDPDEPEIPDTGDRATASQEAKEAQREALIAWYSWAAAKMERHYEAMEHAIGREAALYREAVDLKKKKKIQELTDQVDAYERVINSRKMLTVYDIGQTVYLPAAAPPEYVPATVRGIEITPLGTYYHVGYWLNGRWLECLLPEDQLTFETPLRPPNAGLYPPGAPRCGTEVKGNP